MNLHVRNRPEIRVDFSAPLFRIMGMPVKFWDKKFGGFLLRHGNRNRHTGTSTRNGTTYERFEVSLIQIKFNLSNVVKNTRFKSLYL